MNDKFFIQQPIRPISQPQDKRKQNLNNSQVGTNFQELLEKQINENQELQFSKHARERLHLRNIQLNPEALSKLNNAVEKAADKGVKESLILMNDLAFIVSIKNKTVITAIDGENIKENVFTNIDSAVII
ncbi:MAG: hypothetical protein PWQ67_1389 [Clostridia bacterium]|jgi:flagellar operon protein|nr:hypothetical protein [Clostridia bacterium]MDN5322935.1 hypothetical protein [Clostridia bacterium]